MAPQQTSSCGTQVLQRTLGRWHPALLLQEDQPVTCSQLGPGVSIWPGRVVGSHEPQLPSNIIPGNRRITALLYQYCQALRHKRSGSLCKLLLHNPMAS